MSCLREIAVGAEWAPCWVQHLFVWIHQHQVLVTGLLATISAIGTIVHIRKQILQTKTIANQNRQLKIKASLSSGALLSFEVLDYFFRSKRHIDQIYDQFPGITSEDLWQVMGDTVAVLEAPREFTEREISAFSEVNQAPFIAQINGFRRAILMEIQFWTVIENLRLKLDAMTFDQANISKDERGVARSVAFDPNESPELKFLVLRLQDASKTFEKFVLEKRDSSESCLAELRAICTKQNLPLSFGELD